MLPSIGWKAFAAAGCDPVSVFLFLMRSKTRMLWSVLFSDGNISTPTIVMPDFMSGIHDLKIALISKSWMPATKAGMTALRFNVIRPKTKKCFNFMIFLCMWIIDVNPMTDPAPYLKRQVEYGTHPPYNKP
jgi:hypothetical protein